VLQLVEFIATRYKKVAEIGIGKNTLVAERLMEKGVKVVATDLKPVKTNVEFYIDDVLNPKIEIYREAELVYSIRPPPELFSAIKMLAEKIHADCLIKPLYGDYADGELVNYKGLSFYFWKIKNKHGCKTVSD